MLWSLLLIYYNLDPHNFQLSSLIFTTTEISLTTCFFIHTTTCRPNAVIQTLHYFIVFLLLSTWCVLSSF